MKTVKSKFYFILISCFINLNLNGQTFDIASRCDLNGYYKMIDSIYIQKRGINGSNSNNYFRTLDKRFDSIVRLSNPSWHFDLVYYRDTLFFNYWQEKLKKENKLYYTNPPNLLYTPPQLSQSRIASLTPYDSMTFYYFTWYTIKADWDMATMLGEHRSHSYTKEKDAEVNGDLPDGLWHWYDSAGYNRVYILRKLVLQRTPCAWIITAYKDQFYTPDKLHPAQDSFDIMMKDGKERFKFEYESTYAQCMTADELIEWNYPLDFCGKKDSHIITGQYRLDNAIWQYAKIELQEKQAKVLN